MAIDPDHPNPTAQADLEAAIAARQKRPGRPPKRGRAMTGSERNALLRARQQDDDEAVFRVLRHALAILRLSGPETLRGSIIESELDALRRAARLRLREHELARFEAEIAAIMEGRL